MPETLSRQQIRQQSVIRVYRGTQVTMFCRLQEVDPFFLFSEIIMKQNCQHDLVMVVISEKV